MSKRVRLLNIKVDNLTQKELLEEFRNGLLVTPNVDHLILLQEHQQLFEIYQKAEYVTVDSQILYWTMQLIGRPVKEKIAGSDFLPAFCEYHRNNQEICIFLVGGIGDVASRAAEKINKKFEREMVVGACSPSMQFAENIEESESVIKAINKSEANVLVVGLGTPKQEIWSMRYRQCMPNVKIIMCVGAAIDFMADSGKRAPVWMQRSGLEWLHRLLHDPFRLWRRYLVRDIRFFILTLREILGVYHSPYT